jgi:hypothetical protein
MRDFVECGEIECNVVTRRSGGEEKFGASADGHYGELFFGREADDFCGLFGGCGLG